MPIQIALASSSEKYQYDLKATKPENKEALDLILEDYRVLAGDSRVKHGRGKPARDIYLVALETINSKLSDESPKIVPEECLVFEDSVPGVAAGRRAGIRVIWVPHSGLFGEWGNKVKDVLAGRSGLMDIGNAEQLGEVDDGFGEYLPTLEDFSYEKYGIELPV